MSPAAVAALPATEPLCTCVETSACPRCGTQFPLPHSEDAQQRVAELETQVRILTGKATAAADKIADYEDSITQLKASRNAPPSGTDRASEDTDTAPAAGRAASLDVTATATGDARLGVTRTNTKSRFSIFSARKAASPSTVPTLSDPDPEGFQTRTSDSHALMAALANERHLREQAETNVAQMAVEIEDLSVTLFQQANDMVAQERRARAKLEARIEVLETRNRERAKRLDALEQAVTRIERVRGLLGA